MKWENYSVLTRLQLGNNYKMLGYSTNISCSNSAVGMLTRSWLIKKYFECWHCGEIMLGSPENLSYVKCPWNLSYVKVLTEWSFLNLFTFSLWYFLILWQFQKLIVSRQGSACWETPENCKTYSYIQIFQSRFLCSYQRRDCSARTHKGIRIITENFAVFLVGMNKHIPGLQHHFFLVTLPV